MKNRLLIASFAISGFMGAQCNYKCGYNQDENGNTVHLKQCNEYSRAQCSINCDYDKSKYKNKMHEYEAVHPRYVGIFNRVKTDKCCMTHCILTIRELEKDTICLKHGKYNLNTNAIR